MRYCLTLNLKDDPSLIVEYEAYHQKIWPEVVASIKNSGIQHMEIYRWSNRLFMIVEADENFNWERKAAMDAENQKVQEWEELMWKYQEKLPKTKPEDKWQLMEKIFQI